jgi:hypothetical protein
MTQEDELFLRGKNALANRIVFDDPNRSEFELHTISMFEEASAYQFVENYLEWNISNNPHRIKYDSDFVRHRLSELRTIEGDALIRRPVHAKILADLALIPNQNVQINNEYDLYQEFIFRIAARETTEKGAREPVGLEARIDFMLEIAWWLWSKKKEQSFSIDEIPDSITKKAIAHFEQTVNRETALREMLIGSVLERSRLQKILDTKDEIRFFFPHRSYWEFLLAEYIARLKFESQDVDVIAEAITERVIQFVRQRPDRAFMTSIGEYSVGLVPKLPFSFVVRLSKMQNQNDIAHTDHLITQNHIAVIHIDLVTHILSCCLNSRLNWPLIDKYANTLLFSGNAVFDCVFLTALSWATANNVVNLQENLVMITWQKISCQCVLKTYQDWYEKHPGALKLWSLTGKFPHAKTAVQRVALKHHRVVGSRYYAAGMVFGQAISFRRRNAFNPYGRINLSIDFVPNILGHNVEGISKFGPDRYKSCIVTVDPDDLTDDIVSEEDRLTLRQIVAHGKWAIDLSVEDKETNRPGP